MPSGTPTPAPSNFPGYRLGKIGKRWVFVDPLGKVMLLRGLYKTSPDQPHKIGGGQQAGRTLTNNVRKKYAGAGIGWNEATATRLKQFDYNSTASASRYLADHGLAFQAQYNTRSYTGSGGFGVLREAVTDILKYGVRQNFRGQNGWVRRRLIDCFDPKFKQYSSSNTVQAIHRLPGSKGERLGCDQAQPGRPLLSGRRRGSPVRVRVGAGASHGEFIALIGKPVIAGPVPGPRGGTLTWSVDQLNHTKRALIDFLIAKCQTIAALNALGTRAATTRRSKRVVSARASPMRTGCARARGSARTAQHSFPGMMMDAYLRPFAERLQMRYPGALFIGHTGVGSRGYISRKPVWESYGRWLHLVRAGSFGAHANDAVLNRKVRECMGRDIPWVTSLYFPNNDDGSIYYIKRDDGTQATRGTNIARTLNTGISYQAGDGTYPVVGNNFWGMYDQPGERIGWGIFSYNDNPYDGRDYRVAQPDPYTPGRTTLTEDRVYGDAITPIKNAHITQLGTLQTQFGA